LGALSSRRPEAGFPLPLTDGAVEASVTWSAGKEARCAWVIAAGPRGVAKQLKA